MPAKPILSVIMPVHNGAQWIGSALDSLMTATSEIEIIVIDSSPNDATAAIVEQYAAQLPLRLLRRPRVKPWQVKTNMGVEIASADHACMLHQDDIWLPGRVNAVRHWIAEAPEAALHLAPSIYIDRDGRGMGPWQCPLPSGRYLDREMVLERLLVQNFVSVPGPVFRRSAWLESGGMDKLLWYTADWDMWLKLASDGPVVYHDETTTGFRIHDQSLTVTQGRDSAKFREQMDIVLERHLDRIPAVSRDAVENAARASIKVNVMLAAASSGSIRSLFSAMANILALGPRGMRRYLRDSRIRERVTSRLRARLAGAF